MNVPWLSENDRFPSNIKSQMSISGMSIGGNGDSVAILKSSTR